MSVAYRQHQTVFSRIAIWWAIEWAKQIWRRWQFAINGISNTNTGSDNINSEFSHNNFLLLQGCVIIKLIYIFYAQVHVTNVRFFEDFKIVFFLLQKNAKIFARKCKLLIVQCGNMHFPASEYQAQKRFINIFLKIDCQTDKVFLLFPGKGPAPIPFISAFLTFTVI